jgi:hypothetical protein
VGCTSQQEHIYHPPPKLEQLYLPGRQHHSASSDRKYKIFWFPVGQGSNVHPQTYNVQLGWRNGVDAKMAYVICDPNVKMWSRNCLCTCKIWGFHGGDYKECRLLVYRNPFRTSQKTHYFSATESSQLMPCKIWGFDGGDYEECRLLGYRNTVRTSQETYCHSTIESSQLMLWKIWGFHGGHCEVFRLLACDAVWFLSSVPRLLVRVKVFLISPIHVILKMEMILYSGTLIPTRATRRHIQECGFLRHVSLSWKTAKLCRLFIIY